MENKRSGKWDLRIHIQHHVNIRNWIPFAGNINEASIAITVNCSYVVWVQVYFMLAYVWEKSDKIIKISRSTIHL